MQHLWEIGTKPPGRLRPPGTRAAIVATKPSEIQSRPRETAATAVPGDLDIHAGNNMNWKLPVSYWDTLATEAAVNQVHQLSWELASSHMEQKLACSFGK